MARNERGAWWRAGWCVGIGLAYFGSAKLGLELAFTTPSVTAIWPPAGIALAALVLGGRGLWPGVALGAFLANVTTDVPLYTALGITLGNTLEGLAGAYMLERVRFRPSMERLRDIWSLVVLAGVISTMIAATIGVASLSLGDSLADDALSVWRVWWLGDMGGILLVATFLLVAVTHWPYRDVPGKPLEAVALFCALAAFGILAFGQSAAVAYLVFPFLIWAGLRFLQPGATAAALVAATIAVAFTASGEGQFMEPDEDESLLLAQTFSAVAGLSALILATVTSQRRRAERAAHEVAHGLQVDLLPRALPQIPKMDVAAWYRAGSPQQEVGGDFYDVFQTEPGEWMAVIGDVCGKGPEAASLTALARYTVRAVTREAGRPSEVLLDLNEAILDQRSDRRFMTVALARFTGGVDTHTVTVSVGGHPLPMLVRATGEVEDVGSWGSLLGIDPNPQLYDHLLELRSGDALLLFTDGLVESREATGDGSDWVRELLGRCAGESAATIVDRLRRAAPVRDDVSGDDIALLVISSRADGAWRGR